MTSFGVTASLESESALCLFIICNSEMICSFQSFARNVILFLVYLMKCVKFMLILLLIIQVKEHLINLDIIYGVHGESVADWTATVASVVQLEPTHISAYGLTVEGGTPLADDPSRHPDDDVQAEMYEVVDDLLTAAGMENYEVSNWSLPGRECQHNRLYWFQGNYAGFGSAAHAHHDGRRSWNVRTPDRFIELIESAQSAESSNEILDGDARRIEGLQLALRMREGVPVDSFSASDLELMNELVLVDNGHVTLTRAGRLMANEVALRLR
jgi:oxygen-independent coproporphyrinogen-3 oxidase